MSSSGQGRGRGSASFVEMVWRSLAFIEQSINKMDVDANQNEMFPQGRRGGYYYDSGRGGRGRRGGQACPMNQTIPRQSANLRLQRAPSQPLTIQEIKEAVNNILLSSQIFSFFR